MEIKKYTAKSMSAALDRIRDDFGDDAVIISTQQIPAKGYGQPAMFEVIASGTPLKPTYQVSQANNQAATLHEKAKPQIPQFHLDNPALNTQGFDQQLDIGSLMKELTAVKSQIKSLNTQLTSQQQPEQSCEQTGKLLENGVSPEVISWVKSRMQNGTELGEEINTLLPETDAIAIGTEAPRIMALVGPTGVGKTTTIAKIAAHYRLEENASVALITTDTYRVGATQQLEIYAGLLGVELEIASTPQELKKAIRKHLDKNLILIDTAGRSHHNKKRMCELNDLFGDIPQIDICLALNASVSYEDLKDITQTYEDLGIDKCIITKMDETRKHGNLFNIAVVVEKPIPFITMGQKVPEDIRQVQKSDILDAIMGNKTMVY